MSELISGFALPPGFILILGAFILPLLEGKARYAAVLILPLLTLAMVWVVPDGSSGFFQFMDYELEFDEFHREKLVPVKSEDVVFEKIFKDLQIDEIELSNPIFKELYDLIK